MGVMLEKITSRYDLFVANHNRAKGVLAYFIILAPQVLAVFITGLIQLAGMLLLIYAMGSLRFNSLILEGFTALLLALAFFLQAFGFIVKERCEMLLVALFRQITFHRFVRLSARNSNDETLQSSALTYPNQISQIAYSVDFVLSILQFIILFSVCFIQYRENSVVAVLLLMLLCVGNVLLIRWIGKLWKDYVDCEGKRRNLLSKIIDKLPHASRVYRYNAGLDAVVNVRKTEQRVLYKRIFPQLLSNIVEQGGLTLLLAGIVLVHVTLFPNAVLNVGILFAVKYLYSAMQNNVVNYRVIRLAFPMEKDLVRLERDALKTQLDKASLSHRAVIDDRMTLFSQGTTSLLNVYDSIISNSKILVPYSPILSQGLIESWFAIADDRTRRQYVDFLRLFCVPKGVADRFLRAPETLSVGERQRVILAMAFAQDAEYIVLDDVFAVLNPELREIVAQSMLRSRVQHVVLFARNPEYIPQVFHTSESQQVRHNIVEENRGQHTSSGGVQQADCVESKIPTGAESRGKFLRTVRTLFSASVLFLPIATALIVFAELIFVENIATNTNLRMLESSALLASLLIIVGIIALSLLVYAVPIVRLTKLHNRLIMRFHMYANIDNKGDVLGRLGDDFSDLQMSIPGAIARVIFIVVQTAIVLTMTMIAVPKYVYIIIVMVPLSCCIWYVGSRLLKTAADKQAQLRDRFLGALSSLLSTRSLPQGIIFDHSRTYYYTTSEHKYWQGICYFLNIYTLRNCMMQGLSLILECSILYILTVSSMNFASASAVLYFVVMLSSSLENVIETLQDSGVVSQTAQRVFSLEYYEQQKYVHQSNTIAYRQLSKYIADDDIVSIALIGESGSGKSVLLQEWFDCHCVQKPVLIEDYLFDDNGAIVAPDFTLLKQYLTRQHHTIIMLDETFKSITSSGNLSEREMIIQIIQQVKAKNNKLVVVLHAQTSWIERTPSIFTLF